jgi:hypothetical protein
MIPTTSPMIQIIDTPSTGLPIVPDFSEGSDLVAKMKKGTLTCLSKCLYSLKPPVNLRGAFPYYPHRVSLGAILVLHTKNPPHCEKRGLGPLWFEQQKAPMTGIAKILDISTISEDFCFWLYGRLCLGKGTVSNSLHSYLWRVFSGRL